MLFLGLCLTITFFVGKLVKIFFISLKAGENEQVAEFGFSLISGVVGIVLAIVFLVKSVCTAIDFAHVLKSPTTYLIVESKALFSTKTCEGRK